MQNSNSQDEARREQAAGREPIDDWSRAGRSNAGSWDKARHNLSPYITGALVVAAAIPLAVWLMRGRGASRIAGLAMTAGEGLLAYGNAHAPSKREIRRGVRSAKRGLFDFASSHAPSKRELQRGVQDLAQELLAFAASQAPTKRELRRGARDAGDQLLEHAPTRRELRRLADDARETARDRLDEAWRYGRSTAEEAWQNGEKRARKEAKRRGWW
ncbi:MAG: hypothetical protein JWM77_85 [Rhodospirillales bacterium]|nr:hypothetical protein [Rhodospirillales bacterium]